MLLALSAPAKGDDALALMIRPDHIGLMRHAHAPGYGDPPTFRLGDCGTQRNLDDRGRAEARAMGERLRSAGIVTARVYSSEWCRCRETADLLALGPVEPLALLNSLHDRTAEASARSRAVRTFLAALPPGPPVLLVTHHANIGPLTGVYPTSGEIVVARRGPEGALTAVGRSAP